jgi:hypothetical protein
MDAPTVNVAASAVKLAFEAHCAVYTLNPNPSDPTQSSDPQLCPFIHSPPVPPDYVATGFGPKPGQEVGPAPSGWTLGWVNPPQGAAAHLPDMLPQTTANIGLALLILVPFVIGLRLGHRRWRVQSLWRRRSGN